MGERGLFGGDVTTNHASHYFNVVKKIKFGKESMDISMVLSDCFSFYCMKFSFCL